MRTKDLLKAATIFEKNAGLSINMEAAIPAARDRFPQMTVEEALDFLGLPETFSKKELNRKLINNILKAPKMLTEKGRDAALDFHHATIRAYDLLRDLAQNLGDGLGDGK